MFHVEQVNNLDSFQIILAQEHGHFQCDACGRIFNFSTAIDAAVTRGLEGFQIKQRDVYFRGLCADCQSPLST